jgi:hypothetical protein
MAPKKSSKGKKRSKKCSRKSSCPKKPSLFMDDIRWMQFKKASQEAVQASLDLLSYTSTVESYEAKVDAQNLAWKIFYTSVNPLFITQKFLDDTKLELNLALVPIFTKSPGSASSFYTNSTREPKIRVHPYKTDLIIKSLHDLKKPIEISA